MVSVPRRALPIALLSLVALVFRDVFMLIQYVVIALLVITPIAYTPNMVPPQLKVLMYANPLYYFISSYQHLVLANTLPPVEVMVIGFIMSVGMLAAGLWFFRRTSVFLSDLI